MSDRDILTHAGKITHEAALAKAEGEYDKFRALTGNEPSPVELDFEAAVEKLKLTHSVPKKPRKLGKKDEG